MDGNNKITVRSFYGTMENARCVLSDGKGYYEIKTLPVIFMMKINSTSHPFASFIQEVIFTEEGDAFTLSRVSKDKDTLFYEKEK